MMENTEGFGDNSFFAGCLVSHHSSLLNFLPWGLEWILCRWDSAIPIYSSFAGLLFWGLFSIRVRGIAACFGGVFSSAFSVLTKVGVGTSSIWG